MKRITRALAVASAGMLAAGTAVAATTPAASAASAASDLYHFKVSQLWLDSPSSGTAYAQVTTTCLAESDPNSAFTFAVDTTEPDDLATGAGTVIVGCDDSAVLAITDLDAILAPYQLGHQAQDDITVALAVPDPAVAAQTLALSGGFFSPSIALNQAAIATGGFGDFGGF